MGGGDFHPWEICVPLRTTVTMHRCHGSAVEDTRLLSGTSARKNFPYVDSVGDDREDRRGSQPPLLITSLVKAYYRRALMSECAPSTFGLCQIDPYLSRPFQCESCQHLVLALNTSL